MYNFNLISIKGRFIYGYLCLANAITHAKCPSLPNSLNVLLEEFVSSDNLDDWFDKVGDILPSFISNERKVSNIVLESDKISEIKEYYKSVPKFITEIIDNLISLGMCNLYVSFNPSSSLRYLNLIIAEMEKESILLPDFRIVENCSIQYRKGWGEKDDLRKYR